MPRKSEIQAEELATASPRRSVRLTSTTRATSAEPTSELDRKPITRRRSSAAEENKATVTKTRKLKGSEDELAIEESTEKNSNAETKGDSGRVTRRRRSLSTDEPVIKDKRLTRARRMSTENQEEHTLTPSRTLRSSVDKEDEPDPKTPKPITKSRKRASVSLDPIEEKIETNSTRASNNSKPVQESSQVILPTPMEQTDEPGPSQLDLSIIQESCHSEEESENKIRRSSRLSTGNSSELKTEDNYDIGTSKKSLKVVVDKVDPEESLLKKTSSRLSKGEKTTDYSNPSGENGVTSHEITIIADDADQILPNRDEVATIEIITSTELEKQSSSNSIVIKSNESILVHEYESTIYEEVKHMEGEVDDKERSSSSFENTKELQILDQPNVEGSLSPHGKPSGLSEELNSISISDEYKTDEIASNNSNEKSINITILQEVDTPVKNQVIGIDDRQVQASKSNLGSPDTNSTPSRSLRKSPRLTSAKAASPLKTPPKRNENGTQDNCETKNTDEILQSSSNNGAKELNKIEQEPDNINEKSRPDNFEPSEVKSQDLSKTSENIEIDSEMPQLDMDTELASGPPLIHDQSNCTGKEEGLDSPSNNSKQPILQGDVSPNSNKENIPEANSTPAKNTKKLSAVFDNVEGKTEVQNIVSDIFKPKEIEYNVPEPMEVDEESFVYETEATDGSEKLESEQETIVNKNSMDEKFDGSLNLSVQHTEAIEESTIAEPALNESGLSILQDSKIDNSTESNTVTEQQLILSEKQDLFDKLVDAEEEVEKTWHETNLDDTSSPGYEFHVPSDDEEDKNECENNKQTDKVDNLENCKAEKLISSKEQNSSQIAKEAANEEAPSVDHEHIKEDISKDVGDTLDQDGQGYIKTANLLGDASSSVQVHKSSENIDNSNDQDVEIEERLMDSQVVVSPNVDDDDDVKLQCAKLANTTVDTMSIDVTSEKLETSINTSIIDEPIKGNTPVLAAEKNQSQNDEASDPTQLTSHGNLKHENLFIESNIEKWSQKQPIQLDLVETGLNHSVGEQIEKNLVDIRQPSLEIENQNLALKQPIASELCENILLGKNESDLNISVVSNKIEKRSADIEKPELDANESALAEDADISVNMQNVSSSNITNGVLDVQDVSGDSVEGSIDLELNKSGCIQTEQIQANVEPPQEDSNVDSNCGSSEYTVDCEETQRPGIHSQTERDDKCDVNDTMDKNHVEIEESEILKNANISFDSQNKKTRSKNKSSNPNTSQNMKDSVENKPLQSKEQMENLEAFVDKKLLDVLETSSDSQGSSNEDEEDEYERNEFIDDEALEGEEDTPSEDSNQIVDEGESLHSSESEAEPFDKYDSDDSFICDEEIDELLSGEEYDLDDSRPVKTKKSRIINVENNDSDVITFKKKEKPATKIKRSRIIVVSSSSSADENESDSDKGKKLLDEAVLSDSKNESTRRSIVNSEANLNSSKNETTRKSSITILENIKVKDIGDSALTERISKLVDTFCNTMKKKGDISMNLSLECTDPESPESSEVKSSKYKDISNKRKGDSNHDNILKKKKKRSSSFENKDKTKTDLKRRISRSAENLKIDSKKRKKSQHGEKSGKQFQPSDSVFHDMVAAVSNSRPKRIIRPSSPQKLSNSWKIDVAKNIRPSTTTASKKEMDEFKKRVHPKDFRQQMLYDSGRVKRLDSKTMLRKHGVYYLEKRKD